MAKKDPVRATLNVEGWGQHATEEVEVDRDEWNALDAEGRNELLNDMAHSHAANYVGWGWHIEDEDDDLAATS